MRFKRSDVPGFLIAVAAPPLLTLLVFNSFEIWDHRGTPLLGFIAANIAVAFGLMAMFTRFVRNWDIPVILAFILATVVGIILWMQRAGLDGNAWATGLKWVGVLTFLALNVSIGYQVLVHGLLPIIDRRDQRRARQQ